MTASTFSSFISLYLFIFVGLEFELRASCLQSRHPITRVTPPAHFCSGYFGDGGAGLKNYLPGVASNHNPLDLSRSPVLGSFFSFRTK
jgi:hypothetical protein